MGQTPLALALAAGVLAAVNPCGFALLPAYLSVLLLGDPGARRSAVVARALLLTVAVTAGFAGVFATFGLVLAPVAGALYRHLPWFTIGFGLLLVGAGAWLLAGRSLPGLPLVGRAPAMRGSVASMVAFGAAYALASLGCTIGPFLAIVVASFRAGSTGAGLALFLAYAAGMGLTVGLAALAVALARAGLLARVRRSAPVLARLGGLLLVLVGGYVAYYGWYEIRLFGGAGAGDPVVEAAGRLQAAVAGALSRLGPGALAAAGAVLLLGAVLWARRRPVPADGDRTDRAPEPRPQPGPAGD